MSIHEKAKKILIDVVPLSEQGCKIPTAGKLAYALSENFVERVIDGIIQKETKVLYKKLHLYLEK